MGFSLWATAWMHLDDLAIVSKVRLPIAMCRCVGCRLEVAAEERVKFGCGDLGHAYLLAWH